MERKYDQELATRLKERQIEEVYMGTPITIKRLPDLDEEGAMDPRLYQDMKKQLKLIRFMPAKMMKIDSSVKGIEKLRKMFNAIKSIPVCQKEIQKEKFLIKASDGYEIPVYKYSQAKTNEKLPVLFYIHGGGFFAGHHGVVEESLKIMCEKYAFPIFSIDYRLAPENPYPIGHQDCYTALKWIYENAATLQINKELLFVAGDSAGGNLAQYCSTRDKEERTNIVKGQLLLYPTLNMVGTEDFYFHWSIDQYKMTKLQEKGLSKMIMMMNSMTGGLETILKIEDANNQYLNPYTKDPHQNPPTFISVGEHDFLKIESLGYGAKLHDAGVDVKVVVYNGFGHAYFDNAGVYPQCEDCIDEMAIFINEHAK